MAIGDSRAGVNAGERAVDLTSTLPAELREAQYRAILGMLGAPLLAYLKELSMDVNKIPETKASREFRLWAEQRGRVEGRVEGLAEGRVEGLVEGRRSALLALLSARGLTPSAQEREQIETFEDADMLLECIQYAAAATSVAEALTPLGRGRKPAPQPRRVRSTRTATRKSEIRRR